jgi:hypothetical protein
MYGDTANNWVAQQNALYCYSHEKALEMIRTSSGSFRAALIANLEGKFLKDANGKRRKFEITKKLRKEIEEDDKRAEEQVIAWGRYNVASYLKAKEPKEAKRPLSIHCMVCREPIQAGQMYHGVRVDSKSYRAHPKCVHKIKKPK